MRTDAFFYDGPALLCDGVRLADIAASEGTPAYVYSAAAIERAYRDLDGAFGDYPHRLHYALKANSTLGIVRQLQRLGSGADVNSVGELEVALRAGFGPADIVFTGVGKREDEIQRAVALGVHAINAESPGEIARIREAAARHGGTARVAIRVNPDVDAGSHPNITTGLATSRFGMPVDAAEALCREVAGRDGLRLVGLHAHIGSQMCSVEPIRKAAQTLVALAGRLRAGGVPIDHVDLGGGLGIPYDDGTCVAVADYAATVRSVVEPSGLRLLLEPGRAIVAASGVLLTRVIDIKTFPNGLRFAIVDAGMTELLRPALYGAYHRIEPVSRRAGAEEPFEIVGPLCETSDTYGKRRPMPPIAVGDVLAVRDAGAYGSVMASNYNRRLLAPELLVESGAWRTIRRRQTLDHLLALEP